MNFCVNVSSLESEVLQRAGFLGKDWRIIARTDITPKNVFGCIRKLRRMRIERVCMFCRDLATQQNIFYLKFVALLLGAKKLILSDILSLKVTSKDTSVFLPFISFSFL